MMIASLCVGLDHSGLSNAFLRLSNNPLSKIYSESYNENHIVWMTKMLIAVCALCAIVPLNLSNILFCVLYAHS